MTLLLQALLRELPIESGSISIHGTISYAGLDSLIFSGTVRQYIMLGEVLNRERYSDIIKVCAIVPICLLHLPLHLDYHLI